MLSKKQRLWLFAMCAAWLTLGCADSASDRGESVQEYLFEVEYVNFAWAPTWVGMVIDRDGFVRAYNPNPEGWQPTSDVSFSQEELADKYANKARLVGALDVDEVQRQFDRVAEVGEAFSQRCGCADAGALTYAVFHFDERTERYRPVVLRQEGDCARANTSKEAEPVAAWLRDVIGDVEFFGVFLLDVCLP